MKTRSLLPTGLALTLLLSSCTGAAPETPERQSQSGPCAHSDDAGPAQIPQAGGEELRAAGLDRLPVQPEAARVDLAAPGFLDATNVTNPLFPISRLHSAIVNGTADGLPLKVEITLLPETRIIEWAPGHCAEVLVSQYVAYVGGRIEEVALDLYAQADDGSVWYFGEDVFNYSDGLIADTDGTWIAGKEGPPAMIMPADPEVGDVYRPENIVGLVFEEVTVKAVDKTVRGPRGPVEGAIVVGELHQDGAREEKTFAPGYGEFFTAAGGEVEALALAVPTDALQEPLPEELQAMTSEADAALAAIEAFDWGESVRATRAVAAAWSSYEDSDGVPPRLRRPAARAVNLLEAKVAARAQEDAANAAVQVLLATVDLELPYRSPAEVDLLRFDSWTHQLAIDAATGDTAGVMGDVAVLEWIRDRITQILDPIELIKVDAHLLDLRATAGDEELRAVESRARRLHDDLVRMQD